MDDMTNSTKPVVAVLIDLGVRRQIIGVETRVALERDFEVRWPAGEGQVKAEEAAKLLADADGCMTGWGSPAMDAKLLAAAPKLRIMAHSAGTVRPYVSDNLWRRGIVVTSAAATIAVDVAQFTVALMVLGRKSFVEISPQTSAGKWGKETKQRAPDDLRGCTVGIVAASHVGREVLSLLKHYDVKVLLHDPFVSPAAAAEMGAEPVELDEIFRRSDVVSIHAPDLPATKNMVNASRLAMMRDGATFINTSRGGLVDEAALVSELKRRRIWAFLDVTEPEPPPPGSPLYGCPNLTLTPHIAGSSGRGRKRLGALAAEELRRFFAGEPPLFQVTRDMLDRAA
jgi:phosphoglycerate dehydrogenase-like enzyme